MTECANVRDAPRMPSAASSQQSKPSRGSHHMITSREIAFIDETVSHLNTLLANLRPDVEPIMLTTSTPAPAQIASALEGRDGLRAIHLIAHGMAGEVCFGAGALSLETLHDHAAELAGIGRALGVYGDLLLWSCNTAAGERGSAFVDELTHLVAANVAAASGRVGAAAQGGRWHLDVQASAVHAHAPLTTLGMASYDGVLSAHPDGVTFDAIVNDTGISTTDFITKDNTLTLQGMVEYHGSGNLSFDVYLSGGEFGATLTKVGTITLDGLPGGGTQDEHAFVPWGLTLGLNGSDVLDDGTYTVKFVDAGKSVTNPNNLYPTLNTQFTVDTVGPNGGVTITSVTDDVAPVVGGLTNGDTTNDATPTIAGTAPANQLVAIYDGGTFLGSATADGLGQWTFTPGAPLADGSHTFTATVSDVAGNEGTPSNAFNIAIDATPPSAVVDITAITDDTGTAGDFVTSDQTLTVSGTNGALALGDKVQVSTDGVNWVDVAQDSGTAWHYDDAATHAANFTYQVRVIDNAGNIGNTDSQAVVIDTVPPNASITLNAVTADNVVNAAEAGGTVAVAGTVGGDVQVGDTVTLAINGNTYTGAVQAGGTFSIDVVGSDLAADADHAVDASVTTTDAAGNSATAAATQSYTVDTVLPVASIALDAVTADNAVNAAEAGGNVAITGIVGGDVQVGDTVTLTVNGNTYTGPDQASGAFSIDVAGSDLAADADHAVDASVTTTDAALNSATATDTRNDTVATVPPTASITLNAITPDNVVNAAEASGTVAVTGTVVGDVQVGDTVTLTVNGNTYSGLVASGAFSINVAGSDLVADADHTVDASVTTFDAAGNSATATNAKSYTVDTTVPTIAIDTIAGDNIVSAAEAAADVTISGTTTGVGQGQQVFLALLDAGSNVITTAGATVNGLGHWSYTIAGGTILASAADGSYTVQAFVSDDAGNLASDTHGLLLDRAAPTAAVDITTIADDTGTAGDFVTSDQTLTVSGTNDALALGDSVQVSTDGVNWFNVVQDSGTAWHYDDAATHTANFTYQVRVIDTAGNVGSIDSQAVVIDTVPPTASITLDAVTADNVVNAAEAGGTVAVAGTVGGDVQVGDTVTLVINGNTYSGAVQAGGTFSIDVVGSDLAGDDDHTVDASVTTFDAALNSATATDTQMYMVDTALPTASITLDAVTADNAVNAAEAGGNVAITGTVGGDVQDGDTVTLTVNGNTYSGAVQAGGTFSIDVAGSDLAADADHTVDATDTTPDTALNSATPTRPPSDPVDTALPTASITLDAVTADNAVNAAEAGSNVAITGTVGGDVQDGDTVTLTVNGNTYSGLVASGAFSINVAGSDLAADADHTVDASVTTFDAALKSATATDNPSYTVDTTRLPASTTLHSATPDNAVNAAEAGSNVAITGTVGGDVQDGDTVTLTVNGNTYSGLVASGAFSINVAGSDLAADADHTVDASVTTFDAALNSATATDSQSYTVDTAPPTASITLDAVTADNAVNAAEAGSNVAITGTVGGDVQDGDTVSLTVYGNTYLVADPALFGSSIDVAGSDLAADADHTVDASVTTFDAALNSATATDTQSYMVDTALPTASITLDAVTAD